MNVAALSYEAVWNATPHPAFVVGESDRFLAANTAAETFFGRSQTSLRRRGLAEIAGEGGQLTDLAHQVRRLGASRAQHDVMLTLIDGAPHHADLLAAPVIETPGAVLITIQLRSIAEKMDRSLSHRTAARSVIAMSSMLAHEIKNPLSGISGAAQLLEMSLGDDERELTDLIRQETRRITTLLDRVEQFGDIRPAARREVNIHDVLDRARLSASAGFASHVRFIEEYDPSLPPTGGDADQLMQVFLNLLKNAAEAAPQIGGVITLRTSFRTGMKLTTSGRSESLPLQITVSDNGTGVPQDLMAHIFDPFVTSKAAGGGLGLALVSKIIADHGGVVECESDPGFTTFRLLLPVYSGEAR